MTTKIEITITDNDDIIFIYVYKEKTLIDKYEIDKDIPRTKQKKLIENICFHMGHTISQVIKSLFSGGD